MYTAGSLFILHLADLYDQGHRVKERSLAQKALDELLGYLTQLAKSWSVATQALTALRNMSAEYQVKETEPEPFDFDRLF